MLNSIIQDASFLLLLLWITGALFLISLARIFLLARHNRRMRQDILKMEKQSAEQQIGIISSHHDTASWRAKIQRQFDALRAELAARLDQSERSNHHAQDRLDESRRQELAVAQDKIKELEAALSAAPTQAVVKPSQPVIPTLPAMETLRIEALETELAAAKSALTAARQQNAALRLSNLMARRRQTAPRRVGMRPARHG
jgi:BMFP domain-containing protein YqiC